MILYIYCGCWSSMPISRATFFLNDQCLDDGISHSLHLVPCCVCGCPPSPFDSLCFDCLSTCLVSNPFLQCKPFLEESPRVRHQTGMINNLRKVVANLLGLVVCHFLSQHTIEEVSEWEGGRRGKKKKVNGGEDNLLRRGRRNWPNLMLWRSFCPTSISM